MVKISPLILATLLVCLVSGSGAQNLPFQAFLNADGVQLRTGPSPKDPVQGKADENATFYVLEQQGDWFRIRPTRLLIARTAIDGNGKVRKAASLSPTSLGLKVKQGEQLGLFDQIPDYAESVLIYYPKNVPFWVHKKYLKPLPGIEAPPAAAFVDKSACPLSPESFAKLASLKKDGGLMFVCLPTTIPEGYTSITPERSVVPGGVRESILTPLYTQRFQRDKSWFEVSAEGFAGSVDGEGPFKVQTPLAQLTVSKWVNDDQPYWTGGCSLMGGFVPRTIVGPTNKDQSVPLHIGYRFSPDFTPEQITSVLQSLRLVNL